MKIILTGGGSGGHFYPLIAVAEKINEFVEEEKLLKPEIYFLSNSPYDKKKLRENNIIFKKISAGKLRRYFSILNFFGLFKTGWGFIRSFFIVFNIFPDVVFSNGGNVSFPVLLTARIFRIPVMIHISDSVPGRTNAWAAKFAKKVSLGFPEASELLKTKKDKIAVLGNPVRNELMNILSEGASEFLGLSKSLPTVLVLGGSSGSAKINERVIDALPRLVEKYQVIHQVGKASFGEVNNRAKVVLNGNEYEDRYRAFPYLNTLGMKMAAGISSLIVSRAGAGSISEIAIWGLPSIIIPIPEKVSNDQRRNAFAFSRTGAAVVIEQENLTTSILLSEIDRLMEDEAIRKEMGEKAKGFGKVDAAEKIAKGIINIALEHED
ncbi:MAG: UDP-N-acetylglucosamine--N-acetylmuramyl-(pentapeptide) pyrophosphoryl-undecaprenol N-acetylglucosamine transferase [Patescibacteria group bacterium]|nr:UDP-N-acetylglucosamine--N-acetylmuramyl-(pentapeptide) pyrophosphoryl-undecaprenol N-acetylglucosamine transferase [Patescibacteria group bacterium]